ncbi:hypothetical protein P7D58_00580 [Enterococcus avium]|uniref:hypothetical protein n=1 Tax=Enterococcus avium TaxID=33945 RepID=UPI00288EC71D|nr:hypothetical protein [Enterococcus avium]MDT2392129.1 hypothetical protein [Enterococcus avium]MDT2416731.1 hypothetical protein [Enterococcus avium]MDT2429495.1 hypothetical protein [Enterococcus avium]MDT2438481.1 hypothetical protein [Enterococcus avium]MDT2451337.1 hypothetical protein [Enterococcus avium]
MKKIYWIRRLTLLMAMIGVGAAATGFTPVWIKILLIAGVGGNLLLTEEFEFDLRSRASGR